MNLWIVNWKLHSCFSSTRLSGGCIYSIRVSVGPAFPHREFCASILQSAHALIFPPFVYTLTMQTIFFTFAPVACCCARSSVVVVVVDRFFVFFTDVATMSGSRRPSDRSDLNHTCTQHSQCNHITYSNVAGQRKQQLILPLLLLHAADTDDAELLNQRGRGGFADGLLREGVVFDGTHRRIHGGFRSTFAWRNLVTVADRLAFRAAAAAAASASLEEYARNGKDDWPTSRLLFNDIGWQEVKVGGSRSAPMKVADYKTIDGVSFVARNYRGTRGIRLLW